MRVQLHGARLGPRAPTPSQTTRAQVRHFALRVNPRALSAIAELFLMNGDMCAWLYTGSPAMHSEKITLFEPDASRLKKAGAGGYSNPFIAIRRRVLHRVKRGAARGVGLRHARKCSPHQLHYIFFICLILFFHATASTPKALQQRDDGRGAQTAG
jgi:hypothetical protein